MNKPLIIIGKDYLDATENDLKLFLDAQLQDQINRMEGVESKPLKEQFEFIVI